MRLAWTILAVMLLAALVGVLAWLGEPPGGTPQAGEDEPPITTAPTTRDAVTVRLGLVPERDIFTQRKRYQALADYLGTKLGRPVELVMVNTYESVLQDFADKQIDAAFLGSLVAAMTFDRLGTQVLLKPETEDGATMYRGVIFVPDNSPIRSVADLKGKSVAMVRTTTAGNLFPIQQFIEHGLNGPDAPRPVWVGTHDDAILETLEGHTDAGAVKDLRLDAFEKAHTQWKLRRLAAGEPVPNNALVVRGDLVGDLGARLRQILLEMASDAKGRQVLADMGLRRFAPCQTGEFAAVYDLIDQLGPQWERLEIAGPRPRRPSDLAAAPSSAPAPSSSPSSPSPSISRGE